jgi:hypothetical protein
MKPSLILSVLGLSAIVACQAPPIPAAAPSISFVSFRNAVSNIVIPASSNFVPANFVAEVTSSDRNKVTDVQCFNGATAVTTGAAYRTTCSYVGVVGSPELRAVATNNSNLQGTTTKVVTVDGIPPVATGLQVGGATFDPATGNSFAATITLGATALLRVTSAGSDILGTFIERDGKQIVSSSGNSAQFELLAQTSTPFSIAFGVVDTAGNVARYTVLVSVNKITGDGTAPTVSVASPVAGATVSGNLIVTVNASDAGGIDKVTLIANNNPVTTASPQSGSPSVSFALDTLQFENGVLELKAVAVDKSGLSTTSNAVLTTVNNIQGPVLSIVAPTNNSSVNGIVPVSVNIRKRASAYTYASAAECAAATLPANCGQVKVDLIDYRGTIVGTKFVATVNPGDTKLFEASGFDLSAIPNDFYTITATAYVVVATTTTATVLSDSIVIRNQNTSQQPPAIIIQNPIRVNELQTILPVFRQPFGFVVAELTDNSGLDSVELRATCDSCASGSGPVNALEQYVKLIGTAAKVSLRFDADGTPFLPNGDYTLRVVAQDSSQNRNIQEIKVTIARDPSYVKLNYPVVAGPITTEFSPGSGSCTVTGLDVAKRYRVASWFLNPSGSYIFRDDSITNQTTVTISSTFNATGNWRCFSQVTNVTDARIDWVEDGFTVVKP